jgi:hypothetical protein
MVDTGGGGINVAIMAHAYTSQKHPKNINDIPK